MPRLLRLPERGKLLAATDLQGNLGDFERLLTHLDAAGPDAWLVLTGDLVHGPDEDTFNHWPDHLGARYRDESPRLVEAFIEAQRARPGRVHCLLGNHDHAHIGGPATAKFHDDERAALEARLSPQGRARLKELISSFPLVAVGRCGAVLLHAAPGAAFDDAAQLDGLKLDGYDDWHFSDFIAEVPLLGALLWARAAKPAQSQRFLSAFGGTVALYGHDIVREGYDKAGDDQLCFSTSFGLDDKAKVYVELDLAAHYPDVHALREGRELLKLW
ncbi:MAG: metallophosphoesterase [Archangiaceae bacterium]|nr:metallophosphoesterase [Archangiaceae bacterium]